MKNPRVLVTDHLHENFSKLLESCGVEVHTALRPSREELARLLPGYDAVVVRGRTILDRDLLGIGARGRLRLVVRAGVGLDNIDLEAAQEFGVKVYNTPTASTQSVAELTIALILAIARSLVDHVNNVKNGLWGKSMGFELYGKNLLVVGFGRIGRRVAEIARAIGMRVYAYDIADVESYATRIGAQVVDDLCRGLSIADIVTLHVPLNNETYHMIGRRELFECLKHRAIIVNTSRGAVIDSEALLEALEQGIVAAAALDVLETEPPKRDIDKRLARHPRVIVTPHIGASTVEAQYRAAVQAAYIVAREFNKYCEVIEREYTRVCLHLKEIGLEC